MGQTVRFKDIFPSHLVLHVGLSNLSSILVVSANQIKGEVPLLKNLKDTLLRIQFMMSSPIHRQIRNGASAANETGSESQR